MGRPYALAIAALLAGACTRPGDRAMCVTGDQKACPCLGGGQGVQACLADGTYQPCLCPSAPDLGGGGDDLSAGEGGANDLAASNPTEGDLAAADLSVGDLSPMDQAVGDLAGSDGAADDAGAAGDLGPGITCGSLTCSPDELCCLSGAGTKGSCSSSGSCADGGSPFSCDGPENCPGAHCCVYVDSSGGSLSGHAQCGASCTGSLTTSGTAVIEQSQLCHSNADCTGFVGTLFGVPTSFNACCHSATTQPYRVCIPSSFASLGGFTCP
jgi:hypothetical protein